MYRIPFTYDKIYTNLCRMCKNKVITKNIRQPYCSSTCSKSHKAQLRYIKKLTKFKPCYSDSFASTFVPPPPEQIIHVPNIGYGRCGIYKDTWCQSTWELAFVIWCKDHNKNIERYDGWIPYSWENKQRKYNPDFIVDGQVYEIKGLLSDQVIAKLEGALIKGVTITLIGPAEIDKYFKHIADHYSGSDITKDYKNFYDAPKTKQTLVINPQEQLLKMLLERKSLPDSARKAILTRLNSSPDKLTSPGRYI